MRGAVLSSFAFLFAFQVSVCCSWLVMILWKECLDVFFLLQNLKESSQVTAQDFSGNQDGNHTCVGQVCALKEI